MNETCDVATEDYSDGLLDGAAIADEMMKEIPSCLRVRLAMDTLASAVTVDERVAIENLLQHYLDEAIIIESTFDWDSI